MKFWSKPKEARKELRFEAKNFLRVDFRDGVWMEWEAINWKEGAGHIGPWRDFYKWYFSRSSECFVVRHLDGEQCFRRDDILRFCVEVRRALTLAGEWKEVDVS